MERSSFGTRIADSPARVHSEETPGRSGVPNRWTAANAVFTAAGEKATFQKIANAETRNPRSRGDYGTDT
jgi:hypothetical protein